VGLGLHPHVVSCYYVRRVLGLPRVVIEYVDGGSLLEVIQDGRFDTTESILDAAIQCAWGLHFAHERGLVHRDVKPANLLLTADGPVKGTAPSTTTAAWSSLPRPRSMTVAPMRCSMADTASASQPTPLTPSASSTARRGVRAC